MTYINLDPVIFHIYGFAIRWYSIPYISSFAILIHLCYKHAKINKYDSRDNFINIQFVVFSSLLFGIVCGRIFHFAFYETDFDISQVFKIQNGGMSALGIAFGLIIASYISIRFKYIKFITAYNIVNEMSKFLPISILSGRFANFINGELFGSVSKSGIGIVVNQSSQIAQHPSQIYEGIAVFLFSYFFMLLFGVLKVFVNLGRNDFFGSNIVGFFTGYFCGRLIAEQFKENRNSIPILLIVYVVFMITMIAIYTRLNRNKELL